MKIIRQAAPDVRQALRAVREQLGDEAVILSSRRTKEGVEVTAAVDFDAERLHAHVTPAAVATGAEAAGSADRKAPTAASAAPSLAAPTVSNSSSPWTEAAFAQAAPAAPGTESQEAMSQELKTLRRMLETQLAHLAWSDLSRRAPVQAEMLRELTEVGLAQDLAAQVVSQLPADIELTPARNLSVAALAQQLLVTGDRWLEEGGHVALIGPTGAGKTTALAKLAVRWALRHGTRDLALIAADNMRIGAQEHLQSLGQLLGAPVHRLEDLAGLPALLERIGRRRFVLIDTPGCGPRDALLSSRLAALSAAPEVECTLVLSACTQAGALQEITNRYAPARPTSCLLAKVDEAVSLGGLLSTLIRARLPVAYVSDGQRVPEDLRPARALDLVTSAVQLARESGAAADEDLLRRRFGELAHAIA